MVLSMLTPLKLGDSLYLATLFFFFLVASQLVGSLFPQQGWYLCPLHWKHKVIITGPASKVQQLILDPNILSPAERPDGELLVGC